MNTGVQKEIVPEIRTDFSLKEAFAEIFIVLIKQVVNVFTRSVLAIALRCCEISCLLELMLSLKLRKLPLVT